MKYFKKFYSVPSRHLLSQNQLLINQNNLWNLFRVNNKDQNDVNDFVVVSLLLTLNISRIFFSCFHSWLWRSKWWMGKSGHLYIPMVPWSAIFSGVGGMFFICRFYAAEISCALNYLHEKGERFFSSVLWINPVMHNGLKWSDTYQKSCNIC